MISSSPYTVKIFDLHSLHGISNKTMEMHLKLYEGYVNEANLLDAQVAEFLKGGGVAPEKMPAYAEVICRLGYECHGMKLHEYYFQNLKNSDGEESTPGPLFMEKVKPSFGSYEAWQTDFINTGKVRGVGWAICCADPADGRLSNHWIFLHDMESILSLQPVLVMDVWEHAFLLDYKPSERDKYIKDFFANIDWTEVEARLLPSVGIT